MAASLSKELSQGLQRIHVPSGTPSAWELFPLPGLSLKEAAPEAGLWSVPRARGAGGGRVRE